MNSYRLTADEQTQLLDRLTDLQGSIETLKSKIEEGLPRETVGHTLTYLSASVDAWRETVER